MIYADCNATTPLSRGAQQEMNKAMESWGNPSSTHQIGQRASALLEGWRETVAQSAAVSPSELVFTSGGSEANGIVLLGSVFSKIPGFRLLTSPVEHSSIHGMLPRLTDLKATVQWVRLTPSGALDLEDFQHQISNFKPHLVSIMTANNETGILFPISEMIQICRQADIPFHTDAVQAFGKVIPSLWNEADFISLSAHKVHGPKGTGALVVRHGRKLIATRFGGSQELKRRGGTQNMVGIAGFAGTCKELPSQEKLKALEKWRDGFEKKLSENLDGLSITGQELARLPNTTNVRFSGVPSDTLLSSLDLDGMCVSGGSACASGSITPSHVLTAMGLSAEEAGQAIRISWSTATTESIITEGAELVIHHVKRIRSRHTGK